MSNKEKAPGASMYAEIAGQSEALAQLIPIITNKTNSLRKLFADVNHVILSGCGSGLNAARWAAPLLQAQIGFTACTVPAADIFLFPEGVLPKQVRTVAVLLSRSGRTTEVLQALEVLQDQKIPSLAITCTEKSPLAEKADLALVLDTVVEQAVTTTRSLTGMVLTTQLLAAILSEDQSYLDELHRLPAVAQSIHPYAREIGQKIGNRTDICKYAFVGNGPRLGLAHEGQLKMKETTLLPADAYPMLDFRHGPQSIADSEMLLVALVSSRAYSHELKLIHDMKSHGAIIWAICDQADSKLHLGIDYVLEFKSGLSDRATGPLYMPAIQYMAYYRALSRGLDPDKPCNLSYWIDTS